MLLSEWIHYLLLGNPLGVIYCLLLYVCIWRRSCESTSTLLDQFWKVWLLMGLLFEFLLLIPWLFLRRQWLSVDIVPFMILLAVVVLIATVYSGRRSVQRLFPGLFTGIAFLWPLLVLEGCKLGIVSSSSVFRYGFVQCVLFGIGITVVLRGVNNDSI